MKKCQVTMAPIQEASIDELMAELQRRSFACTLATIGIGPKGEQWHCKTKGSPMLIGAITAVLNSPEALEFIKQCPEEALPKYFNRPT
jgi:hypothetical protein